MASETHYEDVLNLNMLQLVTETSVAPLSEHPIANRCTCGHRNARKGIGMKILMDAEAIAGLFGLSKRQLIIRKKLPKGPTGLLGRSPPGLRRSLVYLY